MRFNSICFEIDDKMMLLSINQLNLNRLLFGFNSELILIVIKFNRIIFYSIRLLLTHARNVLIGKSFENFASLLLEIIRQRRHMSVSLSLEIILFFQILFVIREHWERNQRKKEALLALCSSWKMLPNSAKLLDIFLEVVLNFF